MSTLSKFNMSLNAVGQYDKLLHQVNQKYNLSTHFLTSLENYTRFIYHAVDLANDSDVEEKYNKPMKWIGLYIALASLFCVLLMVGDLIHGFLNRKLWFPCKYFPLNAVTLTVIAVAMKLPVDLNSSMPGKVDQAAKLGSMAFMCIMMANFLPSLANMDNTELGTNVLALGILVITIVVNLCIQIQTGVIFRKDTNPDDYNYSQGIANTYIVVLLVLLLLHLCSALTILKSKEILEKKYQLAPHETTLKDLKSQQPGKLLTVEKLTQHVRSHWIMAGTSSPQFITICSATTTASGVIYVICMIIHVITFTDACQHLYDHKSSYKWSTLVILMIQFLGVILGTISPLFRCFATLSFKFTTGWFRSHTNVFKVESHWTQKLDDWKKSSIPISKKNHKRKIVIHGFKIQILRVCIVLQKTVVVACKMIALIPIFFLICFLSCLSCWKWLKAKINAPGFDIEMGKMNKQSEQNVLQPYVLQLHDDMEVAEGTLKIMLRSVDNFIKKAERKKPENLMNLLKGSRGFAGVEIFSRNHDPCLLGEEPLHCWSLPVVTLMSIATSLPKKQKNTVESLWRSVNEGLVYVTHVEEILNGTDEYVTIQKAATHLWVEVEAKNKWLGNNLKNLADTRNTEEILRWFKNSAKKVFEGKSTDSGSPNDDMSICAKSMYQVTRTILNLYNTNIERVSHDELFNKLSSIISDILAASLTNLPQAITMKCHASAIEKREASVRFAAQLLGETKEIIKSLHEDRELPSLNPDELPFIDKWLAYYLKHPSP